MQKLPETKYFQTLKKRYNLDPWLLQIYSLYEINTFFFFLQGSSNRRIGEDIAAVINFFSCLSAILVEKNFSCSYNC